jgi:hypothetical protein
LCHNSAFKSFCHAIYATRGKYGHSEENICQKYKTACNYLEIAGLNKMEDATIVTNGKRKVVLGENSIIFIHGKHNEEMSYDSFIELNEKYNEVCKLLEQKKFKKRSPYGVRVYEKEGKKYILGKDLILIWGNTREVFNYDQGILFIKYDLYGF